MDILYKFLMSSKANGLSFEFENMIDIINQYNLVNGPLAKTSQLLRTNEEVKYYIYKMVVDDKVSYNIFYDNLHIRMEISSKEKVYSVHLKRQEDDWGFKKSDDGDFCDYSHPTNQTFRVFVFYDVPVLNITRTKDEIYTNGSWDKYVYNTLKNFLNMINNCTDCAQFNQNYK